MDFTVNTPMELNYVMALTEKDFITTPAEVDYSTEVGTVIINIQYPPLR